jgi:chorismate synthase
VEIGSGFAGVRLTGRQHNDAFLPSQPSSSDSPPSQPSSDGGRPERSRPPRTATNHSGGVQGGISNGADVIVRVAFKPTATIASSQDTVDRRGRPATLTAKGRHDPCVLPRAVPLVEAMVCLVLADLWLRQQAVDVLPRAADDRDWR